MSRAAVARILVVLALIVMIPAACAEGWYEKPGQVFDEASSRYVPGTERIGMLGPFDDGPWLSINTALWALIAAVIFAIAALVTSFAGHGTNRFARYGVLAATPAILLATLHAVSAIPPPWRVQALWPALFIGATVLLAGAVAALPSGGRDLAVPAEARMPEATP